jgi:hypothetical protein
MEKDSLPNFLMVPSLAVAFALKRGYMGHLKVDKDPFISPPSRRKSQFYGNNGAEWWKKTFCFAVSCDNSSLCGSCSAFFFFFFFLHACHWLLVISRLRPFIAC